MKSKEIIKERLNLYINLSKGSDLFATYNRWRADALRWAIDQDEDTIRALSLKMGKNYATLPAKRKTQHHILKWVLSQP